MESDLKTLRLLIGEYETSENISERISLMEKIRKHCRIIA